MSEEEEYLDNLDERQFNCEVQNELTLYRGTGDARFVWKAIMLYAEAKKPLPAEFVTDLAVWGARVQTLSKPGDIAAALELTGRKDRHRIGPHDSAAFTKRWLLASEVQRVMKAKRCRPGEAKALVARNRGLSESVVAKAYHAVFTAPISKRRGRREADPLGEVLRAWLKP